MNAACRKLRGKKGFSVSILSYGARIFEITAPDREGQTANVVLNCRGAAEYQNDPWYTGATVGRYANRIASGSFEFDGTTYVLTENEPGVTLHGGVHGFDRVEWAPLQHAEDEFVELRYVSPDGDQGFPGTLTANVRYSIVDGNALRIDYTAITSTQTIVNLTNHSYFNLSGDTSQNVDDHLIQVFASNFTPVDAQKIPTGEILSVEGTALDLRDPCSVPNLDVNYVLDRRTDADLTPAAFVSHPKSGRSLHVATTEPGLQVFSGRGNGIALETQHFPDSPHHSAFPSTVLRPGERYQSTTIYRFFAD